MSLPILPRMYRIKQDIPLPACTDIISELHHQLNSLDLFSTLREGSRVAIAVGSRGIASSLGIIQTIVNQIHRKRATPFIVPAMGSHGAGTPQGQAEILARLGITEETAGCPIQASTEVVSLGTSDLGMPLFLSKTAAESDLIILINRVKPHTRFSAPIESGLVKMCLVGLGKIQGARMVHAAADRYGWRRVYETAFPRFMQSAPPCIGVAIVENARGMPAEISVRRGAAFLDEEPAMLERARTIMPRIPFSDIDLLIVDEMGKNISGTGMDTNVTGRKEGLTPISRHIFIRDLTPETGGNVLGIGLADFTTTRLVQKIDHDVTAINARTAYRTDAAKIPLAFASDAEAIAASFDMSPVQSHAQWRVVWIRNTLELDTMFASEAVIDSCPKPHPFAIDGRPFQPICDSSGNL